MEEKRLDETTLLIPDRPGNRRLDSLRNIVENPDVALLFMIPGLNETLRLNGKASVTVDTELLAPLAVNGKPPRSGVLVEVEEIFHHCAKSLMRARLWDPRRYVDPSFPKISPTPDSQYADDLY